MTLASAESKFSVLRPINLVYFSYTFKYFRKKFPQDNDHYKVLDSTALKLSYKAHLFSKVPVTVTIRIHSIKEKAVLRIRA